MHSWLYKTRCENEKNSCHSEPFDCAQNKLREESLISDIEIS